MFFLELQDSGNFGFKKNNIKTVTKKYPLSIAILTGHFASTIIFRICCEVPVFINFGKQLFTCYSKVT